MVVCQWFRTEVKRIYIVEIHKYSFSEIMQIYKYMQLG